jgi:hypothetical protein
MGADTWLEKGLGLGSVFRVTPCCVEQAHRLFLVYVTALFELKGLQCDRAGVIILGLFSGSV